VAATDAIEALVRRYYEEVWEAGHVEALDDMLADGYVDHDPVPGFGHDKPAAKQAAAAVTSGMKSGKLEVIGLIVQGDEAAAHWTHDWTQAGPFMGGIPADGKELHLNGHDFFRVSDGRITDIWHCENILALLMQLGVVPPMQGGSAAP
jgi:predicted SnoaL-like aldol condensation-catalyzing enzyme